MNARGLDKDRSTGGVQEKVYGGYKYMDVGGVEGEGWGWPSLRWSAALCSARCVRWPWSCPVSPRAPPRGPVVYAGCGRGLDRVWAGLT